MLDYRGEDYSVYYFGNDHVIIFDDGEVFINGKEASEGQKYEIELKMKGEPT